MPDEYNENDGSFVNNENPGNDVSGNSGNNGNNGKDGEDKAKSVYDILQEITGNPEMPVDNNGHEQIPETDINALIAKTNSEVLLKVLSPEVEENEKKKREHKDSLMEMMGKFLTFQFLFTAILVVDSVFLSCFVI